MHIKALLCIGERLVFPVGRERIMAQANFPFGQICAIEGPVASGKTTLLKEFDKIADSNFRVLLEPLPLWRSWYGHDLLAASYENVRSGLPPDGSFFRLQSAIVVSLLIRHIEAMNLAMQNKHVLMERGLESIEAFLELNKHRCSSTEYDILCGMLDQMRHLEKDFFKIYVTPSPSTLFKRLGERGRNCEMGVSPSYFDHLRKKFETEALHKANIIYGPEYENLSPSVLAQKLLTDLVKKTN